MVNLEVVKKSVEEASAKANRKGEVVLMAVSKTHPYEAILECYNLGQRLFGENRVQEVIEKFPPLEKRPEGMFLALIGHLQKNKVKKIVPFVNRIDSVDSEELLALIDKTAASLAITMDVLFEFNSSGEEQKSGFRSAEELLNVVSHLSLYPHIRLCGIMTVGPLGGDEEKNRAAFRETKELFDKVKESVPSCTILSMGMSGDYKIAIEEGSTEVRIGTAIFGERNYNV